MADEESHVCSRDGCDAALPRGSEILEGWSCARVEVFARGTVSVFFIYACPGCTVSVDKKQTSLFENEVSG